MHYVLGVDNEYRKLIVNSMKTTSRHCVNLGLYRILRTPIKHLCSVHGELPTTL